MQCTHFVISDASGQMEDETDPSTAIAAVVGRTNGILMDRVREEQLLRSLEEDDSRTALLHLRKGLSAAAVSWIGVDGAVAEETKLERRPKVPAEGFGVAQEVQRRLSQIRTDLDSFTEVEAYSLMADGYLMSKDELRKFSDIKKTVARKKADEKQQWQFLRIAPWLSNPTDDYLMQLKVGSELVFKAFRLNRVAAVVTLAAVVALCGGAGVLLKDDIVAFLKTSFTVLKIALVLVVISLGFIPKLTRVFKELRFLRAPAEYVGRLLLRALPSAIGSLFVWIHLFIYDPLFLRRGKLERLRPPV
jgi:NTE family protein